MKKFLTCISVCVILLLIGCGEPEHIYYKKGECIIFQVETISGSGGYRYRYRYKVTDSTNSNFNTDGFFIWADEKYNLGDTIVISIKK